MCGIIAVYSTTTLPKKYEDVFEDMLVIDSLRGRDSTGVAFIKTDNSWEVFKKALLPQDLYSMSGYTRAKVGLNKCLLGHNRAASVGVVNNANAHPFEFSNTVGVHNGTMHVGWKFGTDAMLNAGTFNTDSECIYNSINEIGIDETYKKLSGGAALLWFNKVDGSVNAVHNSERPLTYCRTKEGVFIFASEAWMIMASLARNGLDVPEIKDVPEDQLVSINRTGEISFRGLEAKKSVVSYLGTYTPTKVGKFKSKTFVFEVDRLTNGVGNIVYVEGITRTKETVRITLNIVSDAKLYKELKDSVDWFTGNESWWDDTDKVHNIYATSVKKFEEVKKAGPDELQECGFCGKFFLAKNMLYVKSATEDYYCCEDCDTYLSKY